MLQCWTRDVGEQERKEQEWEGEEASQSGREAESLNKEQGEGVADAANRGQQHQYSLVFAQVEKSQTYLPSSAIIPNAAYLHLNPVTPPTVPPMTQTTKNGTPLNTPIPSLLLQIHSVKLITAWPPANHPPTNPPRPPVDSQPRRPFSGVSEPGI